MTENLSLFHVLSSAYFNKTVKKDGALIKPSTQAAFFSFQGKKDFSINYGTDFVISIGQRRVINVESGICCLRRRGLKNINFLSREGEQKAPISFMMTFDELLQGKSWEIA